jgi:hypothetical protein
MTKITIDLKKWATARQLAKEQGWDKAKDCTQRVTNIVKRKEVKTWAIPELGIRLIDRNHFNEELQK